MAGRKAKDALQREFNDIIVESKEGAGHGCFIRD